MKLIRGGFGEALQYARRQAKALDAQHYIRESGDAHFVSGEMPQNFDTLGRWSGSWTVLPDGRYCSGLPIS